MRKVGPRLPFQEISDFPAPSQQGRCQGVGTSLNPTLGSG